MDDKYETNMTTAMTAGSGQWGNWIRGCGRALREEGHINNGISGICVKLYKRNISVICLILDFSLTTWNSFIQPQDKENVFINLA